MFELWKSAKNPWTLGILLLSFFGSIFCQSYREEDAEVIQFASGDPMFSRVAPPSFNERERQMGGFNYTINEATLKTIRSELLYPFYDRGGGKDNVGDYQIAIKDNSPQITKSLNFLLPFFGFGFNYTWVSMHGFLAFSDGPELTNYPLKFPVDNYPNQSDPSFIGPFYSKCKIGELNGDEVDGRRSGVYFRLEQNLLGRVDQFGVELRERVKWDIREGIVGAEWFEPRHAIIVTWKNVTFGGGTIHARKTTNTFQLVLATDETRTYAMFNYKQMAWTTHTEAGGSSEDGTLGTPAFIGFNAGNGTRAFEYRPYSQGPKIQNIMSSGNVNGFPSRHIFRIDEKIMSGQCIAELYDVPSHLQLLSFAPENGNMLGGTIVNVTGPCFDHDMRINCRFNTIQVPGAVIDQNRATCVMPRIFITGYIDIFVEVEGSSDLLWKGKFFVETPEQAPELVSFNKQEILATEPTQITVQWDYKNLTMDKNAPVSITLWGYREVTINPEIVFIETIALGVPNNGKYTFNPQEINNKETPWAKNIQIGLVSVNFTNPSEPFGTPYQPVLWSRPIPLAWYMWPQWQTRRGRWEEKLCEDWIEQDRLLKNYATDIPICPCMLSQAIADKGRFLPDQNCDKDGKVLNCYLHEGAKHCVRSAMPTQSGAGQQCCYDVHGYLMMTADQKWGGRPSRAHDFGQLPWNEANKVPSLSHYHHDVASFFPCCVWQHEQSWWCMTYRFERRPSQNCVGYQPPGVATVFGDPHVYTFDGTMYTFNGKGEFILVRANTDRHKLDVQARFEQPSKTSYGQEVKATILTAVAAKDNQSSTVEIRLRPRDAQWRYKLDVFVDQHRIFFDRYPQKVQTFPGVTVYTPTDIQNQSHVVAMFESGAGVEVIENAGHLTCRVYLPLTFLGQTRGLFGNWSGRVEDDLMLPDGSMGPTASINNFDAIHRQFGSLWAVDNSESAERGVSLFYHESGKTSSNYADNMFFPEMNSDPRVIIPYNVSLKPQTVESFCGKTSYQCKYDYSVTLNKEFAEWTKYYQNQFLSLKEGPLQPIISCGALMTPIHGRKDNFKYTPGTEVQFDCDPEFQLIGERRRVCQSNGQWNVPSSGEDRRTETEWYNWNPSKTTRCIEKGEHAAVASGIAAAIIIGIILFILLIICCLAQFFQRMNANSSGDIADRDGGSGFGSRFSSKRKVSESNPTQRPLMVSHTKKGSDAIEVSKPKPGRRIRKEDIVKLTNEPPVAATRRQSPPFTATKTDSPVPAKRNSSSKSNSPSISSAKTNSPALSPVKTIAPDFSPLAIKKHQQEPYSGKVPSEKNSPALSPVKKTAPGIPPLAVQKYPHEPYSGKIPPEQVPSEKNSPVLSPVKKIAPGFPPLAIQKYQHEPYSGKIPPDQVPSENETSSDDSLSRKSSPVPSAPTPPLQQQSLRTRPNPLGQSRSRKPLHFPDAVYYTGEPLKNRPAIEFPEEDFDEEPRRRTGGRSSSSEDYPTQRSQHSSSSLDSEYPPPLPSVPPPLKEKGEHESVSTGKSVGIILGITIPILLVVLLAFWCYRRRNNRGRIQPSNPQKNIPLAPLMTTRKPSDESRPTTSATTAS